MKRSTDMLKGPLWSGLITYTVPIILTSILQLLFNAADLVIVGRFSGSINVAAVSATGAITNLIINLFIGLSVGAGVTVAHALGGNQSTEVHRIVHTALPTALLGGVLLSVIGVLFSETFLTLMKTPVNVLPLSAKYMRIYFCGMTFTMVYNFCASILRAAGDTKSPLLFLTSAGVLNVVLNIFFVVSLKMTVDGVALATIISQAVSAVLVVIALMRRNDACKLTLRKMQFYRQPFFKIIRIGLPAGIQSSMFAISNVIIQSSINSFDSEALMSGNGAAGNIESFVYVLMNSFQQTAVNYTGQNMGAHQYDRIKKVYGLCLLYVTIAGLIAGSSVWYFGEELLGIYITDSQEAIRYGLIRFNHVALPYFVCGLMDVSTGSLRGLGASVTPMIISILGACGIRILWTYTIFQIPQFHTPECLYTSYLISWSITFIFQTLAFITIYKKRVRTDKMIPHMPEFKKQGEIV
ncbi:MAG: MATE family efflux transporter [Oscillospiraceae bacterium]|nr:MATE family efflux transporter [Oscillospiraceae bacterium]